MSKEKYSLDYVLMVAEEQFILDLTEELADSMNKRGVSRSELAELVGCNENRIRKLQDGSKFDLRLLVRCMYALDCKFVVISTDIDEYPYSRPDQ